MLKEKLATKNEQVNFEPRDVFGKTMIEIISWLMNLFALEQQENFKLYKAPKHQIELAPNKMGKI